MVATKSDSNGYLPLSGTESIKLLSGVELLEYLVQKEQIDIQSLIESSVFDAKNITSLDDVTIITTLLRLFDVTVKSKMETLSYGILESLSILLPVGSKYQKVTIAF
jgi:hypothetical protein